MFNCEIVVNAEWDDESQVYVATSDDVPGLVAEAPSLSELTKKLVILVPELLELNAHVIWRFVNDEVPMVIRSRQVTTLRLH